MTSPFSSLIKRTIGRLADRRAPGPRCTLRALLVGVFSLLIAAFPVFAQSSARTTLVTSTPDTLASAADAGPVPGSQRITLTVTLAQTPDRAAALDQFLADVVTPKNANFHQFLTPAQFAATYGATSDQIASVTSWAAANNLTVDAISSSGTRISISGPASAVQSALAVTLHNYQVSGSLYFANANQPSLPAATASLITAIDGLNTIPQAALTVQSAKTTFAALASTIDANASSILTLDSSLTSASLTTSQIAAYSALFRQASAQGITLLASRPSVEAAFPAALAEVTAVALSGGTTDPSVPTVARPAWQSAPGLPGDALRHTPDLTAASLNVFAQTLSSIETGADNPVGRQGNINRILYELGPTPGLYSQPDSAEAGTWEPATGLGLLDLKTLVKVFPRGTTAVEVDTSSSSYNPIHGAGFVLTTTVYPAASATPTGTITWTSSNGGFGGGTTINLNENGVAVSPTFQLAGGTYIIVSTYSGDGTYAPDTTTTNLTVTSEPGNFTITAPTTATLGGPIAITATVSSPSGIGIPSGTITTTLTGANSQTQYLSAASNTSSTASFTFTASQAGTVAVQSTCTSGDQSFTCFNPQTASVNVTKATPTVSLSLSSTSPTSGTQVTFTSAVTGQAGIAPTGTVNIVDNGTTIATITLPATTATAPLTTGSTSHTITAQYSGDTSYNAATSTSVSATSGVAPTMLAVTAYPTSFSYGQTTTLVIAVAPTSGNQVNNTAPSGVVTVTSGSAVAVTSSALNGGDVNVTLTGLAVGTYPLKVSYAGDANYGASNATVTVTVTPFAATINPMLSYNMFTTGSTQILTVQFASPTNGLVPQNAAFTATLDGTVYTQAFSINGGGVNATGQVTIKAPPAGTYNLQVACVANPDFTCNTPAPISVTSTSTTTPPPGTGTGTSPTQTVLTSSSTSSAAGAAITLTATVSSIATPALTTTPTGTVTFYDGATALTSSPLALSGGAYVATASITLTGSSTHSLTAVYSGDTVFATSTSAAISITSNASSAAITLSASSTTGAAGQAVTFTARVTGSTFSGVVPTGSVTFYLAGTVPSALGTVALGYSGPGVSIATLTTTGLPGGTQKIYAVYSGDGNFAAVTSNTITLGLSDYSASFSPATLSLLAGQSGSATLSVAAIGGYSGTVSLACTPPVNTSITCTFTPVSVSAGGSSTLTVTTVAGKARSSAASGFAARTNAEAIVAAGLAALVCLLLPGRTRRRLVPTLLLVFFALALTANLGCGSNTFSSTTPVSGAGNGTPLGTSILTINTSATDGATTIHHDYSFQVTVQ